MIKRYTLPKMGAIWSQQNKFKIMCEIEILTCEAMAKLGQIPKKAAVNIRRRAAFDVKEIEKIEEKTKHDLIAFLWNIAEYVGEDSQYIHRGLTSSDILDTSLSVMMSEASDILIKDIKQLLVALKQKAKKYKYTVMIGRSHGIHAEPTTFGLKMALFYDEMTRNLKRMQTAKDTISWGKISGAVGTYANINPAVENYVCKKLKLKSAKISTQIIQRDRHAHYLSMLAVIASSLEKFATEIRNLQKTEVLEVEEFFSKGQKGSSAMPHKRNPITCERIAGLARILRGNAIAAMENVALWHERDITHSSVERVIIPDSTILLDYMLNKMISIIKELLVYPGNMITNLNKTKGLVFSQRLLLSLIDKKIKRETAYEIVQKCAMEVWKTGKNFQDILLTNAELRKYLSVKEIKECFDLKYHTKYVNRIFKKVGIN